MFLLTSHAMNMLWLTGQVVNLRYYDDHDKLVFTLKNTEGRFCIEVCPAKATGNIAHGDQVMVYGALFSQWSGKQDTAKIRASLVQSINLHANERAEKS